MKTKIYLFALFTALTTSGLRAQEYDDIYYNSKDRAIENTNVTPVDETQYTSPEQYERQQDYYRDNNQYYSSDTTQTRGQTIVNNYYGDYYDYSYDDYYDYAYTARIRRFYHPYYSYNCGYYCNWYTNCYFYEYDPFCYGTSIYFGYNWLRPYSSWNISWSSMWGWNIGWSWNWGWASYPVYSAWSPWGGYYAVSYMRPWGWAGGYWRGYRNGYWNGYYNGYYDGLYGYNPRNYFYNSRDVNTRIYYGHRSSETAASNRMASANNSGGTGDFKPFYAKYEEAVRKENSTITKKDVAVHPKNDNVSPTVYPKSNPSISTKGNVYDRPVAKPEKGGNSISNTSTKPYTAPPKGLNQKGGNVPYYEKDLPRTTPRVEPKNNPASVTPTTRPYVSPKKDNGVYTAPKSQPVQPKKNTPNYNNYSAPKSYPPSTPKSTSPVRTMPHSKSPQSYSSPKKYSTPKTYSAPKTYSSPKTPSSYKSRSSYGKTPSMSAPKSYSMPSPSRSSSPSRGVTAPRGGRMPR
ncbi:MAG: hypothetical protein D6707_09635 [Bacteroidetes bacterium]|nr:MAG: hypothetical protein D6707_09635 [Bacteroidota bacterium]